MKDAQPRIAEHSLSELERELYNIRQQSLIALRKGDYRTVARCTNEAARINQLITEMDENWTRPNR